MVRAHAAAGAAISGNGFPPCRRPETTEAATAAPAPGGHADARLARPDPEGHPAAATVAYPCPHHACPSAYTPGRVHRAVPSNQNRKAALRH
jgi:hypothetical protein